MTNRLADESSPYLQQHAHNPVDWYPWGPEAFEKARREDKPIFLSVGYSTCYWCHVMERESFESEAIAKLLADDFVSIKVDREERPDVDQLYMTAVQVMTRHGGWPMSVWLTPDLRPFYAGTYFPPNDAHGRPGFATLLDALADAWKNRREEVNAQAQEMADVLKQIGDPPPVAGPAVDDRLLDQLIDRTTSDFDSVHGGYGGAPKFPRQTVLRLLIDTLDHEPPADIHGQQRFERLRDELLRTLDAMRRGGIRDQLGGGFHRYSTDRKWLVPHFEIMLYDQGMLAGIYADAYRLFESPLLARTTRELCEFVLRELRTESGLFISGIDAEVSGEEGQNYLWTPTEVRRVLASHPPEKVEAFVSTYGLASPNFADPHHGNGTPDRNVLFIERDDLAESVNFSEMRTELLAVRERRIQPRRDAKILTSWNALMIDGLARAGAALGEDRYTQAATLAADALLATHRAADGSLYRSSRDGVAKHAGTLEDYAHLASALLTLHELEGEDRFRDAAGTIAMQMVARFAAPHGGFYFSDATVRDLLVRQRSASDSPLPAGEAAAADVLRRLGQTERAVQTVAVHAAEFTRAGESMSALLGVAQELLRDGHAIAPLEAAAASGNVSPVRMSTRWHDEKTLELTLHVGESLHIGGPAVLDEANGRPTEISVRGATIARVDWPSDDGKFAGDVVIALHLNETPADPVTVTVLAQPCSDAACLAPVRIVDNVPPPAAG